MSLKYEPASLPEHNFTGVCLEADEHGAEDFFRVALHVRLDPRYHRRAHEVPVGVPLKGRSHAILGVQVSGFRVRVSGFRISVSVSVCSHSCAA